MKTSKKTAGKTATKTKTIKLSSQTLENAAAQEGQTPAEYVAHSYSTLTGRKAKARHVGTKNGVATFEIAASTAKGNRHWRETRRKGERVLIDPDGHIYHGTAQEVRGAAMTPRGRDALADDIRWARQTARYYTPAELREKIAEKRREAIRQTASDTANGYRVKIKQELGIVAEAAARYMGQTVEEFIAEAVNAAVEATIDKAELDAGKPGDGLPITRHERAALDRLRLANRKAKATA